MTFLPAAGAAPCDAATNRRSNNNSNVNGSNKCDRVSSADAAAKMPAGPGNTACSNEALQKPCKNTRGWRKIVRNFTPS